MKRSKKFSLSDLSDISAEIERGEEKDLIYGGHKYTYRIDEYKLYRDYCAVVVVGGPHKYSATTTCKRSRFKFALKGLIQSLQHK